MPSTGPRLKKIRRLGTPLPGLTRKEPARTNPPGAHGANPRRRRKSGYRVQLEEKQKLRWNYGVSERQLRRYFERAVKSGGVTGEALLELLERRLDSVAFRLGFAPTIRAARQLVSHGHVLVDGRRVDRAGYLVQPGDTLALSERARKIVGVQEAVEKGPEIRLPGFLAIDPDDPFQGRVTGRPSRSDVPLVVDEASVVEFYAR
jgi:small subunit ribosomal protein S4